MIDETYLPGDVLVFLGYKRPEWLTGRYVGANLAMIELYSREEEVVKGNTLRMRLIM